MKRALLLAAVLWGLLLGSICAADSPQPHVRALSLRALQSHLKGAAKGEQRPELLSLCGITRITGYVEDRKNRDLILLGEVQGGAPALHTEDLAVALRAAWLKYGVREGRHLNYQSPGCSIDPDPLTIQRLQEVGDAADAGEPGAIQQWMQVWAEVCSQPQSVRVMGVPFDSHFAKVMVDADYLMKRLADGSLSVDVPGFVSLSDATLARGKEALAKGAAAPMPGLSLNRFWFYPGKPQFLDQDGMVTIEECPVVLLTEEEHLTREGMRGKGKPDRLAAGFAQSFSAHYPDIAGKQPIYQELEGLFRFYALAKAVRYQKVQADLSYLLEQFPVPKASVARTLPGISRIVRAELKRETATGYEVRQLWAPSCGGVAMEYQIGAGNFKRVPARAKPSSGSAPGRTTQPAASSGHKPPAPGPRLPTPTKSQVLKSRPSPEALFWDLPAAPRAAGS